MWPRSAAPVTVSAGWARASSAARSGSVSLRVERVGDRAELHQRVQQDDVVEPGRHRSGPRRAAADAARGEPASGGGRLALELGVGQRRPVGDQRAAIRTGLRALGEPVVEEALSGIVATPCRPRTRTPRPRSSSTRRSSGRAAAEYEDILYERAEAIAQITINRPEVRNAFRPQTLAELRDAFTRARDDTEVGSIIFTGAGDEAFCAGRRPADPRRRRLHRRRRGRPAGGRPARRRRPPRPDPAPAEAGGRWWRATRSAAGTSCTSSAT